MNTTVRYSATIPSGINPLGRKGMVSTPHYLASQAGLDALRRGGTAVDAAIAASAVLSVVYPHMCGLGGDSFWLIYDAARGELKALNASGRAAASASPEFYAVRGFKAVPARGYMAACTVPGAVSGWDEAFKLSKTSMGSPLSWAELLDPAHVNCLEPGKRTMHTLTPAMLLKDGRPRLVYGSMGGEGQPQTLAALTTRIVDFGLAPQDAVNAPRWLLGRSWGAHDNDLKLEGRVPESVAEELRRRGQPVLMVEDYTEIMGHAGAILCDEDGLLQGASDPRGDGQAVAL